MEKQTDQNIKTIRFPITADSKLQKMAEKCGLTKIEFFIAMVDYFYKSKKDPRDLNDELLKKELVKRSDNIVGFIRTLEDQLLRPLVKSFERIMTSQGMRPYHKTNDAVFLCLRFLLVFAFSFE